MLSTRLFRKVIAVFQVKLSQIGTENDKNLKIFLFSLVSCIFSKILDRVRQLERRK